MRAAFAAELVCPACRGPVALRVEEERAGEVWSGGLACSACRREYPVTDGIPRLLSEDVAERAAHWERLHQSLDYAGIVEQTQRRYALPEAVLLDYYAFAGLLRRHGPAPRRALEIGAGSGSYALALHRLAGVGSFCLMDISASALVGARALAAAFGMQADLLQGDVRRLPFRDRAFELSLSGGLIEHFIGAEQDAIVAEHCRVADRVLIEAPVSTPAYWTFRALYSLRPGGWPFGFERPLTRGAVRRLLGTQGFAVEAWSGHDFAAGVELLGRLRWPGFPRLHRWPAAARLSRHDLIALAKRA